MTSFTDSAQFIHEFKILSPDDPSAALLAQYVGGVLKKGQRPDESPFRVLIADRQEISVHNLLNGPEPCIVVSKGTIGQSDNEDQLAARLYHEIQS